MIRQAAAAFDGCRFVVTSRPEGKVPITGFEEAPIADLEPEAIRAFLAKLAKQLYSTDETRERAFREELEAAVNGRREIRKMTRNPVMLTALAVLQHNNVKLPEKRVDLYGSILDWLSKQRAKPGRHARERVSLAAAGVGAGDAESRKRPPEAGPAGVGGGETGAAVRQPRRGRAVSAGRAGG